MDTEVYSNTGGQASKSTPFGAIAKFAAARQGGAKKDLGMMAAMSYGYVYVAQVCMGANRPDFKAFREAEEFRRPLAHHRLRPCINQGIE